MKNVKEIKKDITREEHLEFLRDIQKGSNNELHLSSLYHMYLHYIPKAKGVAL